MADSKITALASIGTGTDPANDPLVIVDVSDVSPGGMSATGTTKKVTLNNLLACSPTATLASATITGDLTVRTNKLAVTSTNVGIGTASPTLAAGVGLEIENAGIATLRLQNTSGANAFELQVDSDANGVLYRGYNNSPHVFYVNNSTAMTLNSTGLGIGASPTQKLHVKGIVNLEQISGGTNGWQLYTYTDGTYRMNYNGAGSDELIIDSSGNVGIGVTPSAWNSSYKATQIGYGSAIYGGSTAFPDFTNLSSNLYVDSGGALKYLRNGFATRYQQYAGVHSWYTVASGIAGATFTDTQAMTLDASGNLLVAATSTSLTTGTGLKILQNSGVTTVGTVGSSSSDVDTTYRLYSSTASAYRFYVGYGGTVYATNTTISAISDARLKENVQDIDVGLGAILALKPRKFDWKAGKGKDIKGDRGFIAQEFEQVFPQLVDQWADEAPEGEAPYKSVRQDLIPVLVKAIQELTARVQTLETR